MASANLGNPQDTANMAAGTAPQETLVNPVDAFFDDYAVAVEADAKRKPKPRPRAPVAVTPQDNMGMGDVSPEAKARLRAQSSEMAAGRAKAMQDAGVQAGAGGTAGPDVSRQTEAKLQDYYKKTRPTGEAEPQGWASSMSSQYGAAMKQPAAPHVSALEKVMAPRAPVAPPAFIKAEKRPINPKLDERLSSFDGARLEAMGQDFASMYAKEGNGSGYKDEELQQVYLGVQEHLRDRVKKGYKLRTMDESKLFEED